MRGTTLLALLVTALLSLACTDEALPRPQRPGAGAESQLGADPVAKAKAERARQFVEAGQRELQMGAFFAAAAAFESALELDSADSRAREGLDRARKGQTEAIRNTGPALATGSPQPLPIVSANPIGAAVAVVPFPPAGSPGGPPVTEPAATTAPPLPALQAPVVPVSEPPKGCLGDEKLAVHPPLASAGDVITISLTSGRHHRDVRLAGQAATPEFLGGREVAEGYEWRWAARADRGGSISFHLFVNFNTLCGSASVPVSGKWEAQRSGLPPDAEFRVTGLAVSPAFRTDGTLFAGFDGAGIYRTVTGSATSVEFSAVNRGLSNPAVLSLAISPDYERDRTVYAGTRAGSLFRTTDAGASWTGLKLPAEANGDVLSVALSPTFATDGTVLVAIDGFGVLVSPDRGSTWAPLSEGLTDRAVQTVAVSPEFGSDQTVFTGSRFGGAYRLTPGPAGSGAGLPVLKGRWTSMNAGLGELALRTLTVSPYYVTDRLLFAAGARGGVFRQDGRVWKQTGLGGTRVLAIGLSPAFGQDGTAYAGTEQGAYRSTDRGDTWLPMSGGLPAIPEGTESGVRGLAVSPEFMTDRTVFAGIWGQGLYRVRD